MFSKRVDEQKDGISLRTIHFWLVITAIVLAGFMFLVTFKLSVSFRHLSEISQQQIELINAARELMDASDYLTEKVQRFTVDGDMRFMEDYFNEAFEANHREEAIGRMSEDGTSREALLKLQEAMDSSIALMDLEYYAMRLVIEAKGYSGYPEILDTVKLSSEDLALSPTDKMRRATELVLNNDYYDRKESIRANMKASLDELQKMADDMDESAMQDLSDELVLVRIAIILQTIGIFFMVWLTSRLGIHPVLNAVNRIKEDSPIPEAGANEFRYLARAYNKMYTAYRSSLEHLNFKVSHDELTGAYNRAGYELLLSSLDLSNTYLLLFDLDNFKSINDRYGHETGDRILKKFVNILKNKFRSDDHICRIGGDEFAVFMVHATELQRMLIAQKVDEINQKLGNTDDSLPASSCSVGIVHGTEASDGTDLFRKADVALYRSKEKGRHTYTFYS